MGQEQVIHQFRGPWGVRVEIHSSIVMLALVFIGFNMGSVTDMLWGAATFAMLVGSIYLHELGHAWGNIIQKVPVRRVVIYGGGGFCEPAASAGPREQELVVAMGPIVNLVIWAVGSMAANKMWEAWYASDGDTLYWPALLLEQLASLNLFLAILNLMPVQPLDGGKLLHLFFLRFLDARGALRVAGGIGLVFSVLWIPAMIGLFLIFGWLLFFIPSVKQHLAMVRLEAYRHLKRWN